MALIVIKINWINELENIMKAAAVHIEMMANKINQKKKSVVALLCTIQISICLFGFTASAKAMPKNVLFA